MDSAASCVVWEVAQLIRFKPLTSLGRARTHKSFKINALQIRLKSEKSPCQFPAIWYLPLVMNATIHANEIPVSHSIRPEVNREFLTVSCPNGWDDVKKISKKVLTFENKKFTFTGWNSDRNEAYFAKPIESDAPYAKTK